MLEVNFRKDQPISLPCSDCSWFVLTIHSWELLLYYREILLYYDIRKLRSSFNPSGKRVCASLHYKSLHGKYSAFFNTFLLVEFEYLKRNNRLPEIFGLGNILFKCSIIVNQRIRSLLIFISLFLIRNIFKVLTKSLCTFFEQKTSFKDISKRFWYI